MENYTAMERTANTQMIQMLNEMLEEERAAVEAVIGLVAMSTDPHEREMLERIGGDEVWSCSGLRDRIEALSGTPSRHISDFANYVLGLDYYPERLRTYGRHQRLIMERINTLLVQRTIDTETRQFLEVMLRQHADDVQWCEQRANVFEASRYGGELPPRPAQPPTPPSSSRGMPGRATPATSPYAAPPPQTAISTAPPVTPSMPVAPAVTPTPPPAAPALPLSAKVPPLAATPPAATPTPPPAAEPAPAAEAPKRRTRRKVDPSANGSTNGDAPSEH
jgi:bacterioferritin (cytochrome b1)